MAKPGSSRQPKYQKIADALRISIRSGEYGPGDRLPGENDLAATFKVATMTARQALAVLQQQGLAQARRGAGVFVLESPTPALHSVSVAGAVIRKGCPTNPLHRPRWRVPAAPGLSLRPIKLSRRAISSSRDRARPWVPSVSRGPCPSER